MLVHSGWSVTYWELSWRDNTCDWLLKKKSGSVSKVIKKSLFKSVDVWVKIEIRVQQSAKVFILFFPVVCSSQKSSLTIKGSHHREWRYEDSNRVRRYYHIGPCLMGYLSSFSPLMNTCRGWLAANWLLLILDGMGEVHKEGFQSSGSGNGIK